MGGIFRIQFIMSIVVARVMSGQWLEDWSIIVRLPFTDYTPLARVTHNSKTIVSEFLL